MKKVYGGVNGFWIHSNDHRIVIVFLLTKVKGTNACFMYITLHNKWCAEIIYHRNKWILLELKVKLNLAVRTSVELLL